jgi:DNA-binding MarR family transcriptional regulator
MNNSRSNNREGPAPLAIVSPMHRANRQMSIYIGEVLADWDMPSSSAHVLAYLAVYGPCRVGDLTRIFGHKKPTMTSMLDRLVRDGYVERWPNPEDRRSFLVDATAKGKDAGKHSRETVEKFDRSIRKRVTKADMQGFMKVMEAIADETGVDVRGDQSRNPSRKREESHG